MQKAQALNLTNIHSVTDFQRNPKGILSKLKTSHSPVVLTVNGKAGYVVQDAEAYQKLLDLVQRAEDIEAVRTGLVQSLQGEGREAADFFAEFESENSL